MEEEDERKLNRITFLSEKNVMTGHSEQMLYFYLINNPNSANIQERQKFLGAQERLDRLMDQPNDETSARLPIDVQSFEQFCEIIPEWNDKSKSWVFFRDHPNVRNCLVYRVQKCGLCYIHGPDLLMHYLVSMTSPTGSAGMIDILAFIRQSFFGQVMEKYIFDENAGGNPDVILNLFLEDDSETTGAQLSDIANCLRNYGPALVTNFEVWNDFYETSPTNVRHSHINALNKNQINPLTNNVGEIGFHAMVLIGIRQNEMNEDIFLLQNFWPNKQFVEVSRTYFRGCRAKITFVVTPQHNFRTSFNIYNALYGDALGADRPVTHELSHVPTPTTSSISCKLVTSPKQKWEK